MNTRKRLLRRFITFMLSTFIIGIVIVLGGLATYQHFNKDGNFLDGFVKLTPKEGEEEEKEKEKLKTNVAVFGVDIDGYRTDTMFVVHFDGERNSADLVSVPRDTKVRFSDAEYERIRAINRRTPRTLKLNEITAYAGIKNVNDFTVKEIERLLGIKIDNYITVEIDAFRKIVDIIDGVEVDVPLRMEYYDRSQGFSVDLYPGLQKLNGAEAEGLVRFRKGKNGSGYRDGDTDRIKTQQLFLKAFAEKLLSKENIAKFPKMIPAILQHVKTDINLLDVPKYYSYASNFDPNSIEFHTIPGVGRYEGSISYYFPDMDKLDDFVQDIFYKTANEETDTEAPEVTEDKSVKIEVLNGGGVTGAAAKVKGILEEDGYNVTNIANYTGTYKTETIIHAKDISKANQFKKYFKNCRVSLNTSIDEDIDIQIVIGSSGI